jgi:hypothetical protein
MSLGSGIFLSSLVIAFTLLLIHKLQNGKLMSFSLKVILCILFITCGSAIGYSVIKEIGKLTAPTEFAGVRFGMTKDEILYEMGQPTKTIKFDGSVVIPPDLERSLIFDKDKHHWHYDKNDYALNVFFDLKTNKVKEVGCYYALEFNPIGIKYCKFKNIGLGASEEEVIENLGAPSDSKFSGIGMKFLTYERLNTHVALLRKVVTHINVSSPPSN